MRMLVLRPQPGAAETARKITEMGFEPVVAPLFEVHSIGWQAPDAGSYDTVMFTSANAVRCAGPQLADLLALPCYAVGDATAAAARSAGFTKVAAGSHDGAALVSMMAEAGIRRALHLCGREHLAVEHRAVRIERRCVYASDAAGELPLPAREALEAGAVALLHSPRAGALFGSLVDAAALPRDQIRLAAISPAAADAAGTGWLGAAAASTPSDDALLELAAKLCQNEGMGAAG